MRTGRTGPAFQPLGYGHRAGVSGRLDAPELVEAVKHAEDVILKAGIPLGGAALTETQTQALLAKGYRLLWHNFDVLMLKQFVRQTAQWRSA